MNEIERSLTVSACYHHLRLQDITVSEVTDYEAIPNMVELSDKDYLTPLLDPRMTDMTPGNSMWLCGSRKYDGKPVMFGGALFQDFREMSVTDYWPRWYRRTYGGGTEDILDKVDPFLDSVFFGRAVYFGDLYCDPKARGQRRTNVQAFTLIGHLISQARWAPDVTYAIMRHDDMMRGNTKGSIFAHSRAQPFRWKRAPKDYSGREEVVWSHPDDVVVAAAGIVQELRSLRMSRKRIG